MSTSNYEPERDLPLAIAGDPEARERLVQHFTPRLRACMRKMLIPLDLDYDDLVTEAWMCFFACVAKRKGQPNQIRDVLPWLCKVVQNLARKEIGRRMRERKIRWVSLESSPAEADRSLEDHLPDPESERLPIDELVAGRANMGHLVAILRFLPRRQGLEYFLRAWHPDWSTDQISNEITRIMAKKSAGSENSGRAKKNHVETNSERKLKAIIQAACLTGMKIPVEYEPFIGDFVSKPGKNKKDYAKAAGLDPAEVGARLHQIHRLAYQYAANGG